jgi:predicted GIY-YIG superfamily endonuclease
VDGHGVIVGRHGGTHRVSSLPRRRHSVYRFYDSDGVLLYVGLSCDLTERLRKHGSEKDWWVEIARVELEHYTKPR